MDAVTRKGVVGTRVSKQDEGSGCWGGVGIPAGVKNGVQPVFSFGAVEISNVSDSPRKRG